MERRSDTHGRRLDEAMEHEVESLTRGSPVEARSDPAREMEGPGDDEPTPEGVIETLPDDQETMSHTEVRARSDLAQHLRPSIFPANRAALVVCAREEHAPPAMVALLEKLSPSESFMNVEQVWEALGGHREERVHHRAPEPEAVRSAATSREPEAATHEFGFAFDLAHRLLALPFGISPASARVVVDETAGVLSAHFGRWSVRTPLTNVTGAIVTGPYWTPKTVGPARLSLKDHGLTFATNDELGLCIQFDVPVHGIDPLGVIRHPGLTVTVEDPAALRDLLVKRG